MAWTLGELAELCGGRVKGDPSRRVEDFAGAEEAGPGKLAFVTSRTWLGKLAPGACAIIPPSLEDEAEGLSGIIVEEPRLAFAALLDKLRTPDRPEPGTDDRAVADPSAEIDPSAHVGPLAYIGPGAKIGAGTIIHPQVHVGKNAVVGRDCVLHPHCYVGWGCRIGDRVVLGPGVSVGHDGFGYHWDGTRHVKVRHVGVVVIEDEVEIGALSAVDRATLGETVIGEGTKIDNMVMVGHNCKIGKHVILVSQVGLSGRVTIGDGAVLAGNVGVKEGVTIGAGVIAGGKAGIAKDVPAGRKIWGVPAREMSAWLRMQAHMEKLPELARRVRELEKKLAKTEGDKENKDS